MRKHRRGLGIGDTNASERARSASAALRKIAISRILPTLYMSSSNSSELFVAASEAADASGPDEATLGGASSGVRRRNIGAAAAPPLAPHPENEKAGAL